MNDVRQLLETKVNIETAMQRADPLMRLVMQRRLDVVCAEIKEALEEWHKGKRGAGTNKERHYGYDDAISVVGDGDCKLAYFSRPQNSQEEEWFAYGSDEDADAIANLAVNMRDELRNCIVEMDKLKAINRGMLEEIGAESPDAELKNRIAELEREVQDYKEENVKLLQQCLSLYRAVKKANVELDKIEESCDNNVWFQKIKERTY